MLTRLINAKYYTTKLYVGSVEHNGDGDFSVFLTIYDTSVYYKAKRKE